ncbi:uncharacterized protein LOC129601406 [Paramacrobiotus metropolitanus]|uniref:uncharacterized protein LOC129601406 n=1 Tax=Paramacrobiotus metropolitanus TaxID=2943436 RepID=UPI0024458870|nr:uncharacterized protein LOC129601406 [Paramacrobiotus metropolitanus]
MLPFPVFVLFLGLGCATAAPSLKYITHHDLSLVWQDTGSGADHDGSYWTPVNLPPGYYYLGHLAKSGHSLQRDADYVTLVKPLTEDAVHPPIALEWVYDDSKTGAEWPLTIFNPVPPRGYTCLGHVALRARRVVSVDQFAGLVCVKTELVVGGVAGVETWNDRKSGGQYDYSSWTIVPASSSDGMGVHNFVGHQSYGIPGGLSAQFVLRRSAVESGVTPIPREDIPGLITQHAPNVLFHPEDQYMPDSAEHVFNNSLFRFGVVNNEGSYDDFSLADAGEIPVSVVRQTLQGKLNQATVKQYLIDHNHISGDIGQRVWLRIPETLWPGNLPRTRAYVRVVGDASRPFTDIVFYFFYPFNGPGKFEYGCGLIEQQGQMTRAGRHQGDFEAYTLRLFNGSADTPPTPVAVYLSVHNGGYWTNYDQLVRVDNHPVVFSAKDSHAMYPGEGVQGYCRPRAIFVGFCTFYVELQDYCGRGTMLRVAEQYQLVDERTAATGWMTFDGRWGDYERVHEYYPMRVSSYKAVESGPSAPAFKTSWSTPELNDQVTCD